MNRLAIFDNSAWVFIYLEMESKRVTVEIRALGSEELVWWESIPLRGNRELRRLITPTGGIDYQQAKLLARGLTTEVLAQTENPA